METREEQQLNLIPVSVVNNCEYGAESSSSFPSISHSSSKENLLYLVQKQRYDSRLKLIGDSPIKAFYRVIRSWASKKFMTGCVILLPIAITFYTTWWFIHFVDDFSPQSISILGSAYLVGLGFVTSITFIFIVGAFMSSWLGASVLSLGEWLIKKMPLISYIYSASKQLSTAVSPDQKSKAFKEVAIIRHPRIGEYAFGFITSTFILHGSSAEIVISGDMSVPRMLTTLDARVNEAIEIAGLENSTARVTAAS